jgi:hypothetical protein
MHREFSNNNASKSIIIGIIFGIVGVGFTFFSLWVGLIIIIFAIVLFLLMKNFASDIVVVCHDQGFTVKVTNKRKGNSVQDYGWSDVTETLYFERESGGEDSTTTRYFQVSTVSGVAFNLYEMKHFEQLIQLFNENTPHLPYYWEKPKGMLGYSYKKQARVSS